MSDRPDAQQVAARELLANGLVAEARGFYAQITTVASAFLGGSVLFRERLPDIPQWNWLLGVAWTGFAASLALIVFVRLNNVAGAQLMIDVIDERRDIQCAAMQRQSMLGQRLRRGAVGALAAGIVALVTFGWVSLYA